MYNVQCTMYNVQCTMYNVQCKLWTIAPLTFSKRRRRKEVEYEKQSLEKKCNIWEPQYRTELNRIDYDSLE